MRVSLAVREGIALSAHTRPLVYALCAVLSTRGRVLSDRDASRAAGVVWGGGNTARIAKHCYSGYVRYSRSPLCWPGASKPGRPSPSRLAQTRASPRPLRPGFASELCCFLTLGFELLAPAYAMPQLDADLPARSTHLPLPHFESSPSDLLSPPETPSLASQLPSPWPGWQAPSIFKSARLAPVHRTRCDCLQAVLLAVCETASFSHSATTPPSNTPPPATNRDSGTSCRLLP